MRKIQFLQNIKFFPPHVCILCFCLYIFTFPVSYSDSAPIEIEEEEEPDEYLFEEDSDIEHTTNGAASEQQHITLQKNSVTLDAKKNTYQDEEQQLATINKDNSLFQRRSVWTFTPNIALDVEEWSSIQGIMLFTTLPRLFFCLFTTYTQYTMYVFFCSSTLYSLTIMFQFHTIINIIGVQHVADEDTTWNNATLCLDKHRGIDVSQLYMFSRVLDEEELLWVRKTSIEDTIRDRSGNSRG